MANANVCPVCKRRVRQRKDGSGLRVLHYINETEIFGYRLKPCRGATTDGSVPSEPTIKDSKKTGIMCRYCGKRVKESSDFRPLKHPDERGRDCRGWSDNHQP